MHGLSFDKIFQESDEYPARKSALQTLATAVKLQSDLVFSLNQARQSFLVTRFDEKMQKVLKKTESTTKLFGDDLKATIDNAKALQKAAKVLNFKPRQPLTPKNLNERGSSSQRDQRGSHKPYPVYSPKPGDRRPTSYRNNSGHSGRLAKDRYHQSQPQRSQQ